MRIRLQFLETFVLKYGFYYYLGMAEPTDQEMPAINKIVCYIHKSQEEGQAIPWGGHMRSVRSQRERGKLWARVFTMVSVRKEWTGRVSGFRIAYFE